MSDAILIDIPVARAIAAHHGPERGLAIIAALADPSAHEAATAAYEALGSKVERTEPEDGPIVIESVFALHEEIDPETGETDFRRTIFWDNGGIVLHGRTMPATTAIALEGSAIDAVLANPLVSGLIMESIDTSPSGDGEPLLVIELANHTCTLADAALHIPRRTAWTRSLERPTQPSCCESSTTPSGASATCAT